MARYYCASGENLSLICDLELRNYLRKESCEIKNFQLLGYRPSFSSLHNATLTCTLIARDGQRIKVHPSKDQFRIILANEGRKDNVEER